MNIQDFIKELKARGCYYDAVNGGIRSKNDIPKGHLCTNGYKMVQIQKDKKIYYQLEHRVVWWWFNSESDVKLVVDHINCDRGDNRIENLELVTIRENVRRTIARERNNPPVGEKSGKTKLIDREALTIRYLKQSGLSNKDIADWIVKDKAVHPCTTVSRIISGVRFGHLKDPTDIWAVYPVLVSATAKTDKPEREQLEEIALGLVGESGEVVDLIKKHLFQGHTIDPDKMKEELGDVLFYLTWLCVLVLGYDRTEVMLRNADKLSRRYPDGFSFERSINRESGDNR